MAQGNDDDQRRILNPLDGWQTGAPDDTAADVDTSWLDADDADVTVPGWNDPEPEASSPKPEDPAAEDADDLELHLEGLTDPEPTEPRRPSWLDPEPTPVEPGETADGNAYEPSVDDDVTDPDPTTPGTPLPTLAAAPASAAPRPPPVATSAEGLSAEALLTDHEAASARQGGRRFPLWSLVILLTAVALLVVGGWGALKEREALKAEIDRLERQVQGSRSQGDLTAREEQALLADNQAQRRELDSLRSRYTDLSVEIDRLSEALARAGVTAATAEPAAAEVALDTAPEVAERNNAAAAGAAPAAEQTASIAPEPSPPARGTPAQSAPAAPPGGPWFVNVASYNSRDTAARWARRVQERFSRVAIQEATVNGRTLYRVRVLGFSDQPTAKAAAADLESNLSIGPLWVGMLSAAERAALDPEAVLEATPTESGPPGNARPAPSPAPSVATPVALREPSSAGGWFIFVDTYARSTDATTRAEAIRDAGYDAKVAVEARAGELFYRVQVVGIGTEAEGEAIVAELARTQGLTNLQLRRF